MTYMPNNLKNMVLILSFNNIGTNSENMKYLVESMR